MLHGMRAHTLGVLFLPHSRQRGLTLVLGFLGRTRTEHLLLREHHRAPLSRRELPDTSPGSLRGRRGHSLEFPLFFGECHHFHSSAPFSCVSVHYGQHSSLWIIPVNPLKAPSVFAEYNTRRHAVRFPYLPAGEVRKPPFA